MRRLRLLLRLIAGIVLIGIPLLMIFAPRALVLIVVPGFLVGMAAALFAGRWFCSLACPFGILQEAVGGLVRIVTLGRFRYRPQPNRRKLRYLLAVAGAVMLLCGVILPVAALEPYSNMSRIVASLLRPLAVGISEAAGSYGLAARPMTLGVICWSIGMLLLLLALLLWKGQGRIYCHTLCPAGALLGILSRLSRRKLAISNTGCIRCGKCLAGCPSGCIDLKKDDKLDFERCTLCFNCAAVCPRQAVGFIRRPPHAAAVPLPERRAFLLQAGGVAVAAAGTALLLRSQRRRVADSGDSPVMPPGAVDFDRFTSRCTACGLCITACTTGVLRPAGLRQYGSLAGIGQPYLNFDHGMCEFRCNHCSEVCPTGALKFLPLPEKQHTRIGMAYYRRDNCVVYLDKNLACGACAEHCPTGALTMQETADGYRLPHIVEALCIGCGSCYKACPQRDPCPISIRGVPLQTLAEDPESYFARQPQKESPVADDWAF